MKKAIIIFGIIAVLFSSCSSGKKALQKGDYFSALYKAVDRLKSSPDNKNASKVLRDGYPMTLEWTQEEMDLIFSSNNSFKWEQAINLMEQTNRLSEHIRSTPAARKIINNPKNYTSELNMAYEKAADARYEVGLIELDANTRESARMAYDHFNTADEFVSGYKNVYELMETAKYMATIRVILDPIPAPSQRYQLSSEFFYNQVFGYLNNQFRPSGFVQFYSPFQAEKEGLENPDFIVGMEFYDFSIGNLTRTEKEETLEKRVQIESKDTTRTQYKTYNAKLKVYSDQVVSGGTLRVRIIESSSHKLVSDNLVPGSFTWVNKYAIFAGDKEALSKEQFRLTQQKAMPLPPEQDLFIEFTKPIYDQLTRQLMQYFRKYR